ncbi:hypothetical protein BDW22DRAFT_513858 [Trametopsis cervina]|nr:hypothetical protein BDW22DRAFT_513858 [Trametopsis cervina]
MPRLLASIFATISTRFTGQIQTSRCGHIFKRSSKISSLVHFPLLQRLVGSSPIFPQIPSRSPSDSCELAIGAVGQSRSPTMSRMSRTRDMLRDRAIANSLRAVARTVGRGEDLGIKVINLGHKSACFLCSQFASLRERRGFASFEDQKLHLESKTERADSLLCAGLDLWYAFLSEDTTQETSREYCTTIASIHPGGTALHTCRRLKLGVSIRICPPETPRALRIHGSTFGRALRNESSILIRHPTALF